MSTSVSSDSTIGAVSSTQNNGALDAAHPYYIHPLDYLGINLVSTVSDEKGYGRWRRAAIIALFAKNKLGFTDGSLLVPTAPILQKSWARCNEMVLSSLLNSLSKEVAESVLYSHSAKDLWKDLEERFGQANGAKLFQLQKELGALVQGNSSESGYFTKMKSLWDELHALNTFSACICNCECGAKTKNLRAHQDERLLQFLMGLNEIFIGVRINILIASPLPYIGQAYSLVMQDEKQREINSSPVYPTDSNFFIATNQPPGNREFGEYKGQKGIYSPKKNTNISLASNRVDPEHAGINAAKPLNLT
ncbi:uncharacterized protein LOC125837571 [Solanum verrucosum]|uniref:uncharacterized protein LOC125837571 n=1 Tax=Solanum verrucosum TaxID=315347 RepID=UPI0020D16951|nr:uncharacterized protein LOC125837571 [Solanum verrucosum]